MSDEALEVIRRTQKRLNGEKQWKQKGPVVTEIQIAVPPLFASFYKFLAGAKTTRPFMSVPVTGKQRSAATVQKLLVKNAISARGKRRLLQSAGRPATGPKAD
jgi:hypothetical protein